MRAARARTHFLSQPPTILPAAGSYLGLVPLVVRQSALSDAAGATTYVTITTGNTDGGLAPLVSSPYALPGGFLTTPITGCGNVTVSAWSTKPGAYASYTIAANYILSVTAGFANATCVTVTDAPTDAASNTGVYGQLNLFGGARTPECTVLVRLRFNDLSRSANASALFQIRRVDSTVVGVAFAVNVTVANLHDTLIDLGNLVGSATLQLAYLSADGGRFITTGTPIYVPTTCLPRVATPIFTPGSTSTSDGSAIPVTVTCPTAGSTLYFTVDGSDPATSTTATYVTGKDKESPSFDLTLRTPGCITVAAYCWRYDALPSLTSRATYCITGGSASWCYGSGDGGDDDDEDDDGGDDDDNGGGSSGDGIYCFPSDCAPLYYQVRHHAVLACTAALAFDMAHAPVSLPRAVLQRRARAAADGAVGHAVLARPHPHQPAVQEQPLLRPQ